MSKRFERQQDIDRENKAMRTIANGTRKNKYYNNWTVERM